MADGYNVPILRHISQVNKINPAKKIAPLGMLSAVLSNQDSSAQLINSDRDESGHRKELKVKYRKRVLESAVSDGPADCNGGATPVYHEFGFPAMLQNTYQLFVPINLLRQYQKDCSDHITLNGAVPVDIKKQTNVMKEMYEMLVEGGQAILKRINTRLVTLMSTQFGVNTVTGNNATRALSFQLGTTGMQDAMVQLISDWRENELDDAVFMVGNGHFSNYDLIKKIMSNMPNDQGVNQSALANLMPKVYFDKDTRAVWGANQVGVFEKGSVHFLTYNDYQGNFRQSVANSDFFTMALPINEYVGTMYSPMPNENLDKLLFDVQVKEFDCAQDLLINGVLTNTGGPGVLISLNKKWNLFTKPTSLYETADPLFGTNGTLRYTITGT
jgi:hypothetical protein